MQEREQDSGSASGPARPRQSAPWPPRTRWPQTVHRAVHAVRDAIPSSSGPDDAPLTLVGLSGGADSLALAVAAALVQQTSLGADASPGVAPSGSSGRIRCGAVIVDHGLQPGSAAVAHRAAHLARALGLDPVLVVPAQVREVGLGPEAAARQGRFAAFEQALERTGAQTVLLAHTRDDQAEQVLLGLARGSGTRSLAGIPARRGPFVRPLLELTRQDTEQICRWAGLQWWEDPSNTDPQLLRSRIRTLVLPGLEDPATGLGPGVAAALARTARIAAEDATALDDWAQRALSELMVPPAAAQTVSLDLAGLVQLPAAVRHRVLARAGQAAGGGAPARERILAVDRLVTQAAAGGVSAGPVQWPGGVVVHRRRRPDCATLDFTTAARPPQAT